MAFHIEPARREICAFLATFSLNPQVHFVLDQLFFFFFFFLYDPLKYLTELLSNNSHVTGPRPVMHVLWLLVRGSEGSACSCQTMETMAVWFERKVKLL